MWTFIGGLIGAIGTVIGFIVIGLILILLIWSIFSRDKGDSTLGDDSGGYGSHGGGE